MNNVTTDANGKPAEKGQPGKPAGPDVSGKHHAATDQQTRASDRAKRNSPARWQHAAPPGHDWSERHCRDKRRHDRIEGGVEIRWPDGDPRAGHHFQGQRVEGANKHHNSGCRQQEVVQDQATLPAEESEVLTACQLRPTKCEQHQRHPDCGKQNEQDEDPARRIAGEAVNRGQQTGTHDECADKRQREGQNGEKNRPAFQGAALFDNNGRVQEGGRRKPGHQRGVLYRVPEPPAAPAKLVICPPASKGDAGCQCAPGCRYPRSDMARPVTVDLPLDQPGHGKGKGHRQPDIADIERRRVKRESRVLQDRVEPAPVERRNLETFKRV